MTAPDVLLVSHTHWDREWYRTFEAFRARLVDTVDRVLELLVGDPEWKFLLDGQAVVVEDYLEVRPDRRGELEAAVRSGRLAIGPWYVQPDSLLPAGETHVRNLLEGGRVASSFGAVSQVAYTPDSFGHPAQLPQLFAGFGLGPFVYWRGNGNELDRLGPVYRWCAPDGSEVLAYHLGRGYFSAAYLPDDPELAATGLAEVVGRQADVQRAPVVLMNGIDHMLPDANTAAVAAALERQTGAHVTRGVLDDLRGAIDPEDREVYRGALVGGRVANLLPGVWSARLGLKLANRAAERALIGWAEPWTALGHVLGLPDEQPSLRRAWRALLANQAHDSICGCSQDRVHEQMAARFDTATELADQTTSRMLERLAGLGPERRVPWSTELDIAVFNPSPVVRTDVVSIRLDGYPVYRVSDVTQDIHPLALAGALVAGYTANGLPARVTSSPDPGRVRMLNEFPALDVEVVVADIPPFGWRRVRLAPGPESPDQVDDGRDISAGSLRVLAAEDGTFTIRFGTREYTGLGEIEDEGDRGDSYDFDPVDDATRARVSSVLVTRSRHESGIQRLTIEREVAIPAGLAASRSERTDEVVTVRVITEARVAPGLDRVDLHVEVTNPARDHRLRLRFPTGAPISSFRAATTFDTARRVTDPVDATGWEHPAPRTFPHQGWIAANGLRVGAPGLPEAEVTPDGVIAVTLLRAVGWLARLDLVARPIPAGPGLEAPGAQCPDGVVAELTLAPSDDDADGRNARAGELGLRAVPAGDPPILPPETALVTIESPNIELSALKPAEDGNGIVLRVLNPTDVAVPAAIRLGIPVSEVTSVRLDETPDGDVVELVDDVVRIDVGPHALRTLRLGTTGS
ncbi:MAG: glycoside hydrolase family 38 N-terminal domain-containing protein [Acidimicrobiia bacterium]